MTQTWPVKQGDCVKQLVQPNCDSQPQAFNTTKLHSDCHLSQASHTHTIVAHQTRPAGFDYLAPPSCQFAPEALWSSKAQETNEVVSATRQPVAAPARDRAAPGRSPKTRPCCHNKPAVRPSIFHIMALKPTRCDCSGPAFFPGNVGTLSNGRPKNNHSSARGSQKGLAGSLHNLRIA